MGLIPPNSKNLGQVGSLVDVIILGLTIIGAIIILAGLIRKEFQTKTSTVRTRLLMMLVFSDLYMGVFGIIAPMFYLITPGPGGPGGRFCDFLSFMLISAFWSQYFAAISLAVSTYCILLHPLATTTRVLQKYYLWFFPAIWVLSFIFAGVAWKIDGYGFNAGFCYLGGEGPEFFSDIFAFVPRTVVLLVVVVLYAHLFIFLRRPDKLKSHSQTDEFASHSGQGHWWGKGRLGRRVGVERTRQGSSAMSSLEAAQERSIGLAQIHDGHTHSKSRKSSTVDPKAPWEAINIQMPSDIPDFAFEPPSRRASEMTSYSRAQPTTPPQQSEFQMQLDARLNREGLGIMNGGRRDSASSVVFKEGSDLVSFASSKHLSDGSLSAHGHGQLDPPSPSASEHSSFTVSTVDSLSAPPLRPAPKRGSQSTTGGGHSGGTGTRKMSLKDILDQETSAIPGGGDGNQTASQSRRASEGVVLNEESLSSYMNRKASLLMILFPMAYVALFFVSLVRIICDFALKNKPIPALSGVSRWLIFSQGIIDLILYGLVEWRIRRGVQRKTQAGHFDSRTSIAP